MKVSDAGRTCGLNTPSSERPRRTQRLEVSSIPSSGLECEDRLRFDWQDPQENNWLCWGWRVAGGLDRQFEKVDGE